MVCLKAESKAVLWDQSASPLQSPWILSPAKPCWIFWRHLIVFSDSIHIQHILSPQHTTQPPHSICVRLQWDAVPWMVCSNRSTRHLLWGSLCTVRVKLIPHLSRFCTDVSWGCTGGREPALSSSHWAYPGFFYLFTSHHPLLCFPGFCPHQRQHLLLQLWLAALLSSGVFPFTCTSIAVRFAVLGKYMVALLKSAV